MFVYLCVFVCVCMCVWVCLHAFMRACVCVLVNPYSVWNECPFKDRNTSHFWVIFKGFGDTIKSLYSIKIISSMESPHKTWKPNIGVCEIQLHFCSSRALEAFTKMRYIFRAAIIISSQTCSLYYLNLMLTSVFSFMCVTHNLKNFLYRENS